MKNIRFRVVSLFLVLFSALPLKINNLDSFELHKFKSAAKVESNVVSGLVLQRCFAFLLSRL